MGEVALLSPEEISVRLAELKEVVKRPLSSGIEHFNTNLPDVVIDCSVGFDSTEPVERSAIVFLDSMVISDSQGLGQDLGIN